MDISITEQRELADYIARKLFQDQITSRKIQPPDSSRKEIAATVWNAIEDYCGRPDPTPDPEDMGRADDFADHYFTRSL